MTDFERAFAVLIGNEGGMSLVASDPGNWTGGAVGRGVLRGTKWGISAASFPTLDIASLSQAQAASIYQVHYWLAARCDLLPGPLALLVFDAAVNNGVGGATRFLQQAVGAAADGAFGGGTLVALRSALGNGSPDRVQAVCTEFQARRLVFMAGLQTWAVFGLGWARRLCRMAGLAGGWPGAGAGDGSTAAKAA